MKKKDEIITVYLAICRIDDFVALMPSIRLYISRDRNALWKYLDNNNSVLQYIKMIKLKYIKNRTHDYEYFSTSSNTIKLQSHLTKIVDNIKSLFEARDMVTPRGKRYLNAFYNGERDYMNVLFRYLNKLYGIGTVYALVL